MSSARCECCGHLLTPKPVRRCYDCGEVITKKHKWSLEVRAGIPTTVHRSCEHPQSYYDLAECRRLKLPPYNGVGESVEECEEFARLYHERMALARGTPQG